MSVIPLVTGAGKLLPEIVVIGALNPVKRISDCSRVYKVLFGHNDSLDYSFIIYLCKMAHERYLIITMPDPPAPPSEALWPEPPPPEPVFAPPAPPL